MSAGPRLKLEVTMFFTPTELRHFDRRCHPCSTFKELLNLKPLYALRLLLYAFMLLLLPFKLLYIPYEPIDIFAFGAIILPADTSFFIDH